MTMIPFCGLGVLSGKNKHGDMFETPAGLSRLNQIKFYLHWGLLKTIS